MPDRAGQYRARPRAAASPERRGSAAERGYGRRWQLYRLSFLAEHPLCEECRKSGRVVEATVVDHIVPHRGDYDLFWDPENHQALCKPHHDRKTGSGK